MELSEISRILKDRMLVAVHESVFHADEIFALAIIKIINPSCDYIRTRDPVLLEKADMRLDVGGKYNVETFDFDHHQADFNERNSPPPNSKKYTYGPKLCGCGLIYRHFGRLLISKILKLNYEKDYLAIDYIYEDLKKKLIIPIDISDNGEDGHFGLNTFPYKHFNITNLIQRANPTILETPNLDKEDCTHFEKALELARFTIERSVLGAYAVFTSASKLRELVPQVKDGVLVLDGYYPWSPYFYENAESVKHIKLVLYYDDVQNNWRVQTTPYIYRTDQGDYTDTHKDGTRRKYKYPIPVAIRTHSQEDIKSITDVDNVTFVHMGGFIAVVSNKEDALKLCKWIIDNQED